MTLPSSTTSKADRVTLEPTSPASVSTVRTSSTAAFSCLPPQRTIAYTRDLSLCLMRGSNPVRALASCGLCLCADPEHRAIRSSGGHHDEGLPALHTASWGPRPGSILCADHSGYQTAKGLSPLALIHRGPAPRPPVSGPAGPARARSRMLAPRPALRGRHPPRAIGLRPVFAVVSRMARLAAVHHTAAG